MRRGWPKPPPRSSEGYDEAYESLLAEKSNLESVVSERQIQMTNLYRSPRYQQISSVEGRGRLWNQEKQSLDYAKDELSRFKRRYNRQTGKTGKEIANRLHQEAQRGAEVGREEKTNAAVEETREERSLQAVQSVIHPKRPGKKRGPEREPASSMERSVRQFGGQDESKQKILRATDVEAEARDLGGMFRVNAQAHTKLRPKPQGTDHNTPQKIERQVKSTIKSKTLPTDIPSSPEGRKEQQMMVMEAMRRQRAKEKEQEHARGAHGKIGPEDIKSPDMRPDLSSGALQLSPRPEHSSTRASDWLSFDLSGSKSEHDKSERRPEESSEEEVSFRPPAW